MIKKRLLSFLFPILIGTSIVIGAASFIIPIYDTDNASSENAVPTVSKSNAEAYIKETGGYYISVEDALEAANKRTSTTNVATNVYVIPCTNPIIDTQCKVGSKVTLNFPYEGETIKNDPSRGTYISGFGSENGNIKNQVTIKAIDGGSKPTITVDVGGTINIGGQRRSLSPQSATSGPCVVITMEDNARIDVGGTLNNYGFIKETKDNNSSVINVDIQGCINQQLVIYDWASAGTNGGAILYNPSEDNLGTSKIFPFYLFDAIQIAPLIKFYAGSLFEVMVWLHGDTAGDMYAEGTILGRDSGLIRATSVSNQEYVIWKCTDISAGTALTNSTTNHKISIDVNGNYNFESIAMDLEFMGVPLPIDSSEYFLPFTNFFNINISSGIVNINERVKLMPGASLTVGPNATLNINNEFIVQDPSTFNDKTILDYSINTPAEFINSGIVNINSNFGGYIKAGEHGNENTKIVVGNSNSISTYEIYGREIDGITYNLIFKFDKPLLFNISDTIKADIIDNNVISTKTTLHTNTIYNYISNNGSYYWKADNTILDYATIKITHSDGREFVNNSYSSDNEINLSIIASGITTFNKGLCVEWGLSNANGATINDGTEYTSYDIVYTDNGDGTYTWETDNPITYYAPKNSGILVAPPDINRNITAVVKVGNSYSSSAPQITIVSKGSGSCFEAGTIIETNHGPKAVEDLTKDDLVLTLNHFTGEYEYKPIALLVDHGKSLYKVMELYFSDGTYVGFISNHGLFDATLNQYVDFKYDNYQYFIGHEFIKYDNGENKYVTLIDAKLVDKVTNSYTVISSENQNSIANGLLNVTSVTYGFYNIFDYDDNHMYDADSVKENIMLYGLFEYEQFKNDLPEKFFIDFGLKYFTVSIARGLMTYDDIFFYYNWWLALIESGEAVIY